jgi:cellulose synthase/poly-beta-1,6-N-acetylglucosamine synthase-like glycosyltransferase
MGLLSFIVPAHNEAFEIGRSLDSIVTVARAVGRPFEVIVVNDDSTDRTAEIAREAGARVIDVNLRHISAVRNAGARAAKGDILFFVDADTRLPESTLRAALQALESGAIGGGAFVQFDGKVSWSVRATLALFGVIYSRILHWAAGCFVFARASAFQNAGGFDETVYASEEILLSIALKHQGQFTVVRESVLTSSRKLRLHSPWQIIPFTLRFLIRGPAMLRQRAGLGWWYDGKREH